MGTKGRTILMLNLSLVFFSIPCYSDRDTILHGQPLRDWEQLNSANNIFRMQFFSLGTAKTRYLGIFYNIPPNYNQQIPLSPLDEKPVWIANRNTPIPDASSNLMIDIDGRLKISHSGGGTEAVMFNSVPATRNASAMLLNSGNFVLREIDSNEVIWQSFDYPTDTLLPGMKLGINFKTGQNWSLKSWISDVLPGASGSFTLGVDPNKTRQLIIWWRGNISWTSGIWQNGRFKNVTRLSYKKNGRTFTFVLNENEMYFMYTVNKSGILPRYTMEPDGELLQDTGERTPFGNCFPSHVAQTGCVVDEWPGCRRRNYWFFIRRQGIIYGNALRFDETENLSLFDCEAICRNNCSCVAYASTSYNKTGCQIWGRGMRFQATPSSLDEAYIVVSDSGLKLKVWTIWLIIGLGALALLIACSSCCLVGRRLIVKRKAKRRQRMQLYELEANSTSSTKYTEVNNHKDLHLFSYEIIAAATNNFSSTNKLGEGGFGPVYKGKLLDGQEVAIKRLSRSSGQGLVEFKNEIVLIAKLQHTNLVRLLGSCIQGDEKILVYEYMPNKSLDFFLFEPTQMDLLNWMNRFKIIEGIAQGLLYLHKYSRLKVIHRDLKASNILLDDNLNPKISDFGMLNETEANTNRVVGTYGYMSPEYAIKGIVSMKTDVFSFGVLLLEIVSSKKNNSCYDSEHPLNLIGLAWKLWKEDEALELIEPTLKESFPSNEVMRCIHVGLLCVQDHAVDRPSMSEVVSMLTNDTMQLREPKQPAFFTDINGTGATNSDKLGTISTNELTISVMEAR